MNIVLPILFAVIAAIGNSLFAIGNKKTEGLDNPFVFVAICTVAAVILSFAAMPLFGNSNYIAAIKEHWFWAAISGVGLFLTNVGFNLLYTKYGAGFYVLYAAIAIIMTALGVGLVIFKETYTVYHWAAFICALITVVLFALGQSRS
jgi:drug/metabolite transporter (DMT)-like permease